MESSVIATVPVIAPVIVLIALGHVIRRTGIVSDGEVGALKRLIVNIALPAVFFQTFLTLEVDARFAVLNGAVFGTLLALLALGYAVAPFMPGGDGARRTTPFLMTGFEFGMLGISLFGTVWGMEQIGAIGALGLPHELFIWFVYVTVLQRRYGGAVSAGATVRSFLRSPVIIAIVAGMGLNLLGLTPAITGSTAGQSLLRTTEMIAGIIGPLILFVIGHGIRLSGRSVVAAAPLVAIRTAVALFLGVVAGPLLVRSLGLPDIFRHALFTMAILPPPFIVPLYVPQNRHEDLAYANMVLSSATVLSVACFLVYVILVNS